MNIWCSRSLWPANEPFCVISEIHWCGVYIAVRPYVSRRQVRSAKFTRRFHVDWRIHQKNPFLRLRKNRDVCQRLKICRKQSLGAIGFNTDAVPHMNEMHLWCRSRHDKICMVMSRARLPENLAIDIQNFALQGSARSILRTQFSAGHYI